ncbi:MAG: LPS-assembly protein LptD [Hyphomicrobiaceae bacterium]
MTGLLMLLALLLVALPADAQQNLLDVSPASIARKDDSKPMLLQADELVYDNAGSKVTAKGNVEIYYNNYTLLAEQVIYDQGANTLTAEGNVRIKEPDGAVINADHITLTDDFRDGFISSLKIVTKDDARIAAARAQRTDAETTVFESGVYTPCKPCMGNPDNPPLWRIRAGKITHKRSEGNLYYEDAFFDVLGMPIVWIPYFYSPDPSVKRRSGFLAPSISQSERLGTDVEIPYFWELAPNMDVTFRNRYTSKEGTLYRAIFRHRVRNGVYSLDLAGIHQNDQDEVASTSIANFDNEFRGSLVTQGDFSLGSWWSAGWDVTVESDDTFRRYYDLDNVLRTDRVSQGYIVGQSLRNYFGANVYHFGGLLTDDTSNAESMAHPSVDYHYVVDTPILGGELSFDANALSLSRDEGTDTNRIIAEVNWRRQMIDGLGQVYTPFAFARGDAYAVSNVIDETTGVQTAEDNITRGQVGAGLQYQYPFVTHTDWGAHVIEPVVQIVARPDHIEQIPVPNEDAQSLVFDDTLLFDIDKFSGYDRIETGVRLNYGLQYTWQMNNGGSVRMVAGQSQQLSGENPFGSDTGLETDDSDYVAGLYFAPTHHLNLVAQTRIGSDTLDLEREDLGASFSAGPVSGSLLYAFDHTTDQIGVVRDDQEVSGNLAVQLTDRWTALGSLRYNIDLDQTISDSIGVKYADECFALSVVYKESFVQDREIEPDQSIVVRFELKNLGGSSFTTDALGSKSAEEDKG